MNIQQHTDFPPADFVAFLAQRTGLTEEAAEHCLEDWFGEYHASTSDRSAPESGSVRLSV